MNRDELTHEINLLLWPLREGNGIVGVKRDKTVALLEAILQELATRPAIEPEVRTKHTANQTDADCRRDLECIRSQCTSEGKSRGGHLYDGPDCLLCGHFGPTDEPEPCVHEKLKAAEIKIAEMQKEKEDDFVEWNQKFREAASTEANLLLNNYNSRLKDTCTFVMGVLAKITGEKLMDLYAPSIQQDLRSAAVMLHEVTK